MKTHLVWLCVAVVALIVGTNFAKKETQFIEKPVEVIKTREVIVEKPVVVVRDVVKEVPKEVIKEVIREVEVPARLTENQQLAMTYVSRAISAPVVGSSGEVFYKLDSVSVTVVVNDAIKKIVSADRVKDRFESILRQHNIRIDDNAGGLVAVSFEGLWDADEIQLTYTPSIELKEMVVIARKGDLRRVLATVWREAFYGSAGKAVAEKAILDSTEEMAEGFANTFLANHEKGWTTQARR